MERGTLSNHTNHCLDPFDSHSAKCGEDAFRTIEGNQIHTFCPDEQKALDALDGEPEASFKSGYCNGNSEVVITFDQNSVIYVENTSVYAFWQCGYQCISEIVIKVKVI